MIEASLKNDLLEIKQNNYEINNSNTFNFYALQMLEKIGTVDYELRDDLIYDIFANWIDMNVFKEKELCNYLEIAKDNKHLMYNIGLEESDYVFTRTFSALIIALIIQRHLQKNFLYSDIILDTQNIMLNYMALEKDIRGYIDEKGWAHSVAHGADVLSELSKCNEIKHESLLCMLNVFKLKICQGKYVYIDGEPDRINVAVKNILNRDLLSEQEIITWLGNFSIYIIKDGTIEKFHQRINIKNYLRSLYFIVKDNFQYTSIIEKIEEILTYL